MRARTRIVFGPGGAAAGGFAGYSASRARAACLDKGSVQAGPGWCQARGVRLCQRLGAMRRTMDIEEEQVERME
jgi:hypothetical protein